VDTDPTRNTVVFAINRHGKLDRVVGQGETKSDHCIQTVWESLRREHSLTARQVQEIYSEWEPSKADSLFLDHEFKAVKVSYSFQRPENGNWDEAFAQVRKIIEKSLSEKTENQAAAPLPILRDMDNYAELVAHIPLTPNIGIFLANVGFTERGTIGIDYVMKKTVQEQRIDLKAMWGQAFSNLARELKVNVAESKNGQRYFILQREQGLAAAAIGLPDFSKQAETWLNTKQLLTSIPDPNTLIICAANAPIAQEVKQLALQSDYVGSVINLTPSVLYIDDGEISVLARKPNRG
jgi:hypothetical protein